MFNRILLKWYFGHIYIFIYILYVIYIIRIFRKARWNNNNNNDTMGSLFLQKQSTNYSIGSYGGPFFVFIWYGGQITQLNKWYKGKSITKPPI